MAWLFRAWCNGFVGYRRTHDDHGAVRMRGHLRRHRAQQQLGESADATAAHDNNLRGPRLFNQDARRTGIDLLGLCVDQVRVFVA